MDKTRATRQTEQREPNRMDVRETPEKRQRLRKGAASVSPTNIPQEMIPPDTDLQWVTDSIHGEPTPQIRQGFEINGWRPVTSDMFGGRFDGMFMPKGHKGEINVMGEVLMERPLELTIEARQEQYGEAVRAKTRTEATLRNGELPGVRFDTQHPSARKVTSISHERVQMPIPE